MLDQDVTMSPPDVPSLGAASKTSIDGSYTIESSEGKAFPYAVLQVRWEFSRVPEIVRVLDNSHLAERVRGFTLETEAIYNICSPQGMPKPLWQPLLGRDIRKLPTRKSRRFSRRGTDGLSSPSEPLPPTSATSSNGGASDSVFSTAQGQSSATSVMGSVQIATELSSPVSTKFTFAQAKSPKPKNGYDYLVPRSWRWCIGTGTSLTMAPSMGRIHHTRFMSIPTSPQTFQVKKKYPSHFQPYIIDCLAAEAVSYRGCRRPIAGPQGANGSL
jgi:hypothetical protein